MNIFDEMDSIVEAFGIPVGKSQTCKGKNCSAKNGVGHSDACHKEHDKNTSSVLDTAGNRNPAHRYAGYKGHRLPDYSTKDQIEAYHQGVNAREYRK